MSKHINMDKINDPCPNCNAVFIGPGHKQVCPNTPKPTEPELTQEDKDWMNGSAGPIKDRVTATPKPDGNAEPIDCQWCGGPLEGATCLKSRNKDLQDIIYRQAEQVKQLKRGLEEKEREVAAGKSLWTRAQTACKRHALRADELEEQIKTKDRIIDRYTKHDSNCCALWRNVPCTCGLEKARKGDN